MIAERRVVNEPTNAGQTRRHKPEPHPIPKTDLKPKSGPKRPKEIGLKRRVLIARKAVKIKLLNADR